MLTPARAPASTVAQLDKGIRDVLALDDVKQLLANQPDYQSSADFRRFIEAGIASWARRVQKGNVQLR